MKVKTWIPAMSDKETADLAYWERNMLALLIAHNDPTARWYYDDAEEVIGPQGVKVGVPRFEGWRRVISLRAGSVTFHIPDDFETGDLSAGEPNWDGHTTDGKWKMVAELCGICPGHEYVRELISGPLDPAEFDHICKHCGADAPCD